MRWRNIKHKKQNSIPKIEENKIVYAGFWSRVMGFSTDIFMIGMPISLLMMGIFGRDEMKSASAIDVISHDEAALQHAPDPSASIFQILLSMAVYVYMWRRTMQTPGKKMARTIVVDAKSFERASYFQLIIRFLGYFISAISIVGFFIGLFREDKRTLHDLLSRTAVIYEKRS
jgi:uncharacterized RDD family membrane protein YckC